MLFQGVKRSKASSALAVPVQYLYTVRWTISIYLSPVLQCQHGYCAIKLSQLTYISISRDKLHKRQYGNSNKRYKAMHDSTFLFYTCMNYFQESLIISLI